MESAPPSASASARRRPRRAPPAAEGPGRGGLGLPPPSPRRPSGGGSLLPPPPHPGRGRCRAAPLRTQPEEASEAGLRRARTAASKARRTSSPRSSSPRSGPASAVLTAQWPHLGRPRRGGPGRASPRRPLLAAAALVEIRRRAELLPGLPRRRRARICVGGERRGIFASRLASEAKCLSCMRVLLETLCLPKKHCSDAFLGLGHVMRLLLETALWGVWLGVVHPTKQPLYSIGCG